MFSRVAILELNLPGVEAEAASENERIIEIIIRENVLELGDGSKVLSSFQKTADGYDLDGLSQALVDIKQIYPQKTDATLLLERQIEYDHLVAVMDTVRARQADVSKEQAERMTLFPDISIGDAP